MRALLGIIFALLLTISACAQSLLLQGVTGPMVQPVYSFGGFITGTTGSTSVTAAAVPLGTARADRYIYVLVEIAGATVPTISTMTVGGISAATVGNTTPLTSATSRFEWRVALVPTGTTATVAITASVSVTRFCVTSFVASGLRNPTVAIAGAAQINIAAPTSQAPFATNGGALGFGYERGSSSTTGWTVEDNVSLCGTGLSIVSERGTGPLTALWDMAGGGTRSWTAMTVQ